MYTHKPLSWPPWVAAYISRQHEHLPLNTVDAVVYMTTAWTPSTEYGGCCGIYDDSMNTFHWIRWMLWYIWRQHEHLPLNTVDAVVYITTAWTPSTEYGGCCGIYHDSMNTFHWIRWMLWYISRQHEHLPLNTVDAVVYMTTAWTPSTEYGGCCGIYDDSMNTFHWIRWMLWYIWRQHEHLPLNTVDAVVYMTTAWTPSTEYGGCCGIYHHSMNTFHWIRWMLWYISRQHEHLPLNTVDAVVYMTTAWTPSTEYGGCCGIYDDSMNTFHWIRWMLWYIWRQHEHLPLNTVDAVVYITTAWTPSTEYGGCCGIYDDSMNTFHWIRWMLWYISRQHEHLPLNTVDAVVYMTAWTPSTEYGGCCGIYDDSMNTFHGIRWMLWYIWRQHEHLPLNTVDAVVYITTAWTPSTEYGGCCGIYDDSMNTFHWIRWMLWYIWRQHEHLPLNTVDAVVYMTTTWTPSTEYGGCCGIYDDSMNTFHWIRWMMWYIWRQHEHLPLNTVDAVVYMTTAWTPSTEYGGCCGIYDSMNTFHWILWMLWYIWRQHEHLPLNTVDAVVYMTTAWTPSTEYGGCCGIYHDSMNTFHWIRWMLWYIWRQHKHLPLNTVDAVVYITTAWTPSTEYGGCCGIYDDSMNTFHWIRWMLWYIWRQHEHLPLNTVDAVVYMTTAWTPSTEYGGCCGIYDDSMNTFHWIRWML